MANLIQGILGGFSGSVGTITGYPRNNKWFIRSRRYKMSNPRTEAQQAHRHQFGEMVSLAAKLLPALKTGMRNYAETHGMTEGNAFVHINWQLGNITELKEMQLSSGPVPQVEFTDIEREEGFVTLRWEKNLQHNGARNEDIIKIFAYSESIGKSQCVATVERRTRRLTFRLPEGFREAHLWAIIEDCKGRVSQSRYLEDLQPEESINTEDTTAQTFGQEAVGSESKMSTDTLLDAEKSDRTPPGGEV